MYRWGRGRWMIKYSWMLPCQSLNRCQGEPQCFLLVLRLQNVGNVWLSTWSIVLRELEVWNAVVSLFSESRARQDYKAACRYRQMIDMYTRQRAVASSSWGKAPAIRDFERRMVKRMIDSDMDTFSSGRVPTKELNAWDRIPCLAILYPGQCRVPRSRSQRT